MGAIEEKAVEHRERPILFSGEMVRAILDGKKTQTRRVVCWSNKSIDCDRCELHEQRDGTYWPYNCCDEWEKPIHCPYGEPGDRLWVRSQWSVSYNAERHQAWWTGPEGCGLAFTTHGEPTKPRRLGRQPSIHMPRWVASELQLPVLEVTEVRVERVQAISEADALAEGIQCENVVISAHCAGGIHTEVTEDRFFTGTEGDADEGHEYASDAFATLWDLINGKKHPWASNPWCWVVSFKKVEQAAR